MVSGMKGTRPIFLTYKLIQVEAPKQVLQSSIHIRKCCNVPKRSLGGNVLIRVGDVMFVSKRETESHYARVIDTKFSFRI